MLQARASHAGVGFDALRAEFTRQREPMLRVNPISALAPT